MRVRRRIIPLQTCGDGALYFEEQNDICAGGWDIMSFSRMVDAIILAAH